MLMNYGLIRFPISLNHIYLFNYFCFTFFYLKLNPIMMKLKTNQLICFLFFFSIHCLHAQKYSIGLSTGKTFFTQKVEDEDRFFGDPLYTTRNVYQGDLSVRFNNRIGFKTGIAYEEKGDRRRRNTNFGIGIDENQYNYLAFPVLFEFSIGNKVKLKSQTGLSVEYLLKHNQLHHNGINDYFIEDDTNEQARFNYSTLLGIGLELPLYKKISFEIISRAALGLKTLQRDNSWVRFKHSGFIVKVGLRYDLN